LIVDGAADASVLSEALDSFQPDGVEAFEVDQVFSLADGVSALGRSQPDCVLLDLGLPDSGSWPTSAWRSCTWTILLRV
jgi:DNA-binding response OmpR family regulator